MQNRIKIHQRIRHDINGTAERPRLSVYRSLNNMILQAIDDVSGKTVAASNSLKEKGSLMIKAELASKEMSKKLKELKITSVVFDRGGFRYHGSVKQVAETLRKEGIIL